MFQFLYGAIGSSDAWHVVRDRVVSIPIWCDWKTRSNKQPSHPYEFQFLYGAIGSSGQTHASMEKPVSIPIWCDWKDHIEGVCRAVIRFNSYMVRLEVANLVQQVSFISSFNSYMVRLEVNVFQNKYR